jgi:multidrug efflux pump subunit AcrB
MRQLLNVQQVHLIALPILVQAKADRRGDAIASRQALGGRPGNGRRWLMTAMSDCIGLFPAAVSTGIGSQVQRPLATVVVGGMLIGPIMLLVVVPALRMLFLGEEPDPRMGQLQPLPIGGGT